MPAGDVLLEVVGDLYPAGGHGGVLIGADGDEFHVALDLTGPDQIRHEHEGSLQHPQEQRVAVVELLIQDLTQFSDAGLDLFLRHQDLQDVVLHLTFHGRSPLLSSKFE